MKTPLSSNQWRGFIAAWGGWALDGMDSYIFALAMVPAMRELLRGLLAAVVGIDIEGEIHGAPAIAQLLLPPETKTPTGREYSFAPLTLFPVALIHKIGR
jgi:hypothetical protein